mmetsp:Transcript_50651/g.58066  ORF Transcript_50651/g.58066 Transcript_50651/m.58066 type:complete len:445 (-) Transcript_50651:509-1843(-)|eukprot:CAMPEP_0115017062 /NCGR_PEP_ID=MMETSP0216-20121206/27869_1 /TAXON_ID=223996 /ORGANISM="Protocruzia adherens, Strain Boccale" /LENGTH=444 /DNA_ID=CAMNT_0002387759 /DNA_START=181 /DNA_END=1515 /DNA_ORIENTATION=-
MSNLTYQGNHLAWQQRVNLENAACNKEFDRFVVGKSTVKDMLSTFMSGKSESGYSGFYSGENASVIGGSDPNCMRDYVPGTLGSKQFNVVSEATPSRAYKRINRPHSASLRRKSVRSSYSIDYGAPSSDKYMRSSRGMVKMKERHNMDSYCFGGNTNIREVGATSLLESPEKMISHTETASPKSNRSSRSHSRRSSFSGHRSVGRTHGSAANDVRRSLNDKYKMSSLGVIMKKYGGGSNHASRKQSISENKTYFDRGDRAETENGARHNKEYKEPLKTEPVKLAAGNELESDDEENYANGAERETQESEHTDEDIDSLIEKLTEDKLKDHDPNHVTRQLSPSTRSIASSSTVSKARSQLTAISRRSVGSRGSRRSRGSSKSGASSKYSTSTHTTIIEELSRKLDSERAHRLRIEAQLELLLQDKEMDKAKRNKSVTIRAGARHI